jgi:N-acetyl-beta-hexosaminidase
VSTGVVPCQRYQPYFDRLWLAAPRALEPKAIDDVRDYLERVSKQWDDALAQLKSLVED